MPDSKRPKHRSPRRNKSSARKSAHGSGANSGEKTKLEGTQEAKRPQRSSAPTRSEHGAAPARASATYFYGTHAVSAAWSNPHRPCRALFGTEQALDRLFDSTDVGHASRPTPRLCTSEELSEMVGTGAVHQGLVLSVGALPSLGLEDVLSPVGSTPPDNPSHGKRRPPLLLALDQVTDPQNIGAIMRSASAFDVRAVLVQDRNSPHESGAMAKAASGALDYLFQEKKMRNKNYGHIF